MCSSVGGRTPSIKLAQGMMIPSGRANPHCVIQCLIQYCLQNHKAAHSVAGHSSHAFPVGSRLVRELWPQADKLAGPKPHLSGWLVSGAGHVLPFCYTDKEGQGTDKHRVIGFVWKERVFPNMHTVTQSWQLLGSLVLSRTFKLVQPFSSTPGKVKSLELKPDRLFILTWINVHQF